jgi:hypothetical protein
MRSLSPLSQPCPDCQADPGEQCHYACQSNWTAPDDDLNPAPWIVLVTTDGADTSAHGPFACRDDAAATAYRIEHGEFPIPHPLVQIAKITPADTTHLTQAHR